MRPIDHPDSRMNGPSGKVAGQSTPAAQARRLFDRPQAAYFIFACPKSGTTWLQRLLSDHPATLCAESRAFGDYYRDNPLSLPHLTLQKYLQIVSHHFAPAVENIRVADHAF